ncbi:MAG: hypothetical protein IKT40_12210 [Bacilli bacterium]|nr:hypothetical protein [Bacilli bacterium]
MAELKFLKGLVGNLPSDRVESNFYVTTGEKDGDYRLYLGSKLLGQGDVVARLLAVEAAVGEGGDVSTQITNAINALDVTEITEAGKAIVAVSQADGKIAATTGDVAAAHVTVADAAGNFEATTVEAALAELVSKMEAAVAALDAEVTSADGSHVTVKVTEVDGKITAVNVTESDIASADALDKEIARADAAEKANKKAIEDEVARAKEVEEGLAEDIADEADARAKAIEDAVKALEGELAETDAKTLAAINDKIDEIVANGKSYTVEMVAGDELTALGTNVKEAYKLVETVGEDSTQVGKYIKVYKDSSLESVVLNGQSLDFTYILADGSKDTVGVDVSNFLAEAEFKNGLEVVDHVVNVKVDATSESYLTVDANGVKLAGVDAAIKAAVDAEAAKREEEDGKLSTAISNEENARKAAIEALNATLSNSDEKSFVTVSFKQEDGLVKDLVVETADIASAKDLADEVTRATNAEAANAKSISDEKTRAEGKEGELATAIATEKSRAEGKEGELATAISDEATARENADNVLSGRLDVIEAVKITGKDAIVVSSSDAKADKEVSLKLGTQPGENEAGVVLSQSADGLVAKLQWGSF